MLNHQLMESYRSLPNGTHFTQFSTIAIRMTELRKRFDLIESEIKNIGGISEQLREAVATFRLPEKAIPE